MYGPSSRRIAALDGIRALCILLVLVAHVAGTGIIPMHPLTHVAADLGVRGFFVLSGFLITGLLLRDLDKPVGLALREFYARRALRIFPAFYMFLAGVFVLSLFGLVVWNNRDAIFAATYTMNFHGDRVWSVGHLWSLAVEEQFYLVWPAILLLVGVRRATYVVAAALVVSPIARLALYMWPSQRALSDQAFPCVFDALATGCLLAIGRQALERDARYVRFIGLRWFWAIPACAFAVLAVSTPLFQLGVAPTIANVGIALAMHRCLLHPARVATVLEAPIMLRIGVLSYSIYLWQQLFLNRHSTLWWNKFPVNVVLAISAGTLSYYLIEKPFLRFTARFRSPSRTSV